MKKHLDLTVLITAILISALYGLLLLVNGIVMASQFESFGLFLSRFGIVVVFSGFAAAAIIAQRNKQPLLALTILILTLLPDAVEFPRSILGGYADFQALGMWVCFIALLAVAWLVVLFIFTIKERGLPELVIRRRMIAYVPLFVFLAFFLLVDGPEVAIYNGLLLLLAILIGDYLILAILLLTSFAGYPFFMVGRLVAAGGNPQVAVGTWLEWIFGLVFLGLAIFYLIAIVKKMDLPFIPVAEGSAPCAEAPEIEETSGHEEKPVESVQEDVVEAPATEESLADEEPVAEHFED
ncbi:MAG: hypothetical protein ACOX3K_05555 [Bacilli bacterium]